MQKLKIVMVGPRQSGKTMITNVLSEVNDNLELRPTQGARIVEFEVPDIKINKKSVTASIELWDCSGEHKFHSCWPIVRADTNGVILVHSENNLETQQELELFYNYFITQGGLGAKHCVVFNHTGDNTTRLGSHFARISQVKVDLSDTETLKKDFSEFAASLLRLKVDTIPDQSNVVIKTLVHDGDNF